MGKRKIYRPKEMRSMVKRIKRTRARATYTGFLYLIAIFAITGLAVLPTLNMDYVNVIPGLNGDAKMLWDDLNSLGANVSTISRVLYLIMLIVLIVNVVRGVMQLGSLFKTKASKTYGLNGNVYAMQALGKAFSNSFAVVFINYTLIALLNASTQNPGEAVLIFSKFFFAKDSEYTNLDFIFFVGTSFRLWLGFIGAKISYYVAEVGEGVTEEKRQVGRFASFVRNYLQLNVCSFISLNLLDISKIGGFVNNALSGAFKMDIAAILQLVIVLFWIVLVVHATNMTEYNFEGAKGKGMKNYSIFIFLTFIAAVALYAVEDSSFSFDIENNTYFTTMFIALGAFVMSIIQFLMRNAPGLPTEEEEEEVVEQPTEDIDMQYFFSKDFIKGKIEDGIDAAKGSKFADDIGGDIVL